ncbi:hypothetical protein B0H11DRAFT_2260312 [Mycena galericulata]|nr:hypothetical protein B0H11DRAFT_2260312 [Mycena galericulata]
MSDSTPQTSSSGCGGDTPHSPKKPNASIEKFNCCPYHRNGSRRRAEFVPILDSQCLGVTEIAEAQDPPATGEAQKEAPQEAS